MKKKTPILMFGPNIYGQGGISRVARIYRDSGVFDDLDVTYLSTTMDLPVRRYFSFIFSVIYLLSYSFRTCIVYIHTSSWNSFYRKSIFIALAFLFNKKCVIHVHPSHFYDFLINIKGLRSRIIYGLIRRAANIIVLTESMKKRMSGLFPDSSIWVLRNPIHFEKMGNYHSLNRSNNRFIYLGTYKREKGIYELVDAFENLISSGEDVYLDMYGSQQTDLIRTYAEKKGSTQRIKVNGWIEDPEKIKSLYRAAALILPSHTEGIPNVILEAMSTGCPIISTLVGGLKEVLKDQHNAYIIKVNDYSDICAKVKFCLKNKEKTKRIAQNSLKQVKSEYDINVIKKHFSLILDSF